MRRQQPIAHLLYNHLYPNPNPNDPVSFSAHLARNLVPEVRIEVATFYGDLNSTEARYPGLNYCHPPHRLRLGRFKHHRRLFEAFDELGLTYGEIQDFCCWEGTKWARERYEKDEGITVFDTTGDDIGPYVDPRDTMTGDESGSGSITRKTDISVFVEDRRAIGQRSTQMPGTVDQEMSDSVIESDGPHDRARYAPSSDVANHRDQVAEQPSRRRDDMLSRHIIAAWESGQSLPPEIEQYLKEQSERGTLRSGLDFEALLAARHGENSNVVPTRATRSAAVAGRAHG